jgi:hypothetical protein
MKAGIAGPEKTFLTIATASEQHMTTGFHNNGYAHRNRTVRNRVFCRVHDNTV